MVPCTSPRCSCLFHFYTVTSALNHRCTPIKNHFHHSLLRTAVARAQPEHMTGNGDPVIPCLSLLLLLHLRPATLLFIPGVARAAPCPVGTWPITVVTRTRVTPVAVRLVIVHRRHTTCLLSFKLKSGRHSTEYDNNKCWLYQCCLLCQLYHPYQSRRQNPILSSDRFHTRNTIVFMYINDWCAHLHTII